MTTWSPNLGSLRVHQLKKYYASGGISEVVRRTARFASRCVMDQLYKGTPPDSINPNGKILFLESICPESGMWIGDSICKIPAILAIAQRYRAQIDVIVCANRCDLWRNIDSSQIGEVISVWGVGISKYSNLNLLKAQKYQGVITTNLSIDFLPYLLALKGIPHIKVGNWPLALDSTYRGESLLTKAVKLGYADPVNLESAVTAPRLKLREFSNINHTSSPIIGIHTEAKSALRAYPSWNALIGDIIELHPTAEIRVFWENNTTNIRANTRVKDLRSTTPRLRKLYEELSKCTLCIAPDSGTAHASMALGIPTIVITNVVKPAVVIPRIPRSRVVPIVAPCPNNSPCHSNPLSRGSRCLITGQDENDFSQTPPCMSAPEIGSRILQELELLMLGS